MTRKLFLLTVILFLLISLITLPVFSGCKATTLTSEEVGSAEIKPISPEEVYEIIQNKEDYFIVDVRTPEEYEGGHIEGVLLLPVQELEGRLDELSKDENIIVYCRSGSRSRAAAEMLVNNGFTRVYDMGGISSWIDRGYPVTLEK